MPSLELKAFDALALSLHHSPGVYALLVGSGLSRSAGIATGWEITLDLIRRLAALDGVLEHPDWAAWYHEKYGKEPSYSEILDALASSPSERRSILHGYIDPDAESDARRPTEAHRSIAAMVAQGTIRVVITTNFDRLLENALRDVGVEPTVIASEDAIAGATPLVHSRCTVIKVHGDYLDTRIKNTEAELAGYASGMNSILDEVFDRFGLLVVGWSGEWDIALRAAILRAPSRRYPLYWAARGQVASMAQDIIDHRDGRVIPISDADSFFKKLSHTLDALRLASRPHPESVSMALALARKYCRDDAYAMEWSDFLAEEAAKIRDFVTGSEYPTASPDGAAMNSLVTTIFNRTERLVFLDESGVTTKMARTHARAPRGQRAYGSIPLGSWQRLTVLGALACEGLMATMSIEASTSTAVLLGYLDQVLVPALKRTKPDAILVMDNLRPHHATAVRDLLDRAGIGLLYLPRYSPEFNPIEPAWAKVKERLKAKAARNLEALEAELKPALDAITAKDAKGWIRHAGFALH